MSDQDKIAALNEAHQKLNEALLKDVEEVKADMKTLLTKEVPEIKERLVKIESWQETQGNSVQVPASNGQQMVEFVKAWSAIVVAVIALVAAVFGSPISPNGP
jgi:flagellar motility protein MotE (MotC chaperone)